MMWPAPLPWMKADGFLATATASHIHGPAVPGINAPVLFPFTGLPAATSGSIHEQVISITGPQIADLKAGLYYFNIHNSVFPGGEIRGQILPVRNRRVSACWSWVGPDCCYAAGWAGQVDAE